MSHTTRCSQSQIKDSWKQFALGQSTEVPVREEILASWKRCRAHNVDPFITKPAKLSDQAEIKRRLAASRDLLEVSDPAILHLYQFLNDIRVFISVSDADGYLLSVYGDTSAIDPQHDILYTAWGEKDIGTNPIGTSIQEDRPLQIFGYEHYSRFPHHFAGAGTPIHDPSGKIIGAISITTTINEQQPHTLAMIVMTAYSIEKQLQIQDSTRSIQLAYQHINATVNSISEGVVVIDSQGRISMANNVFAQQLGIQSSLLMGQSVIDFLQDPALKQAILTCTPFSDRMAKLNVGTTVFPCMISLHPMVYEGIHEAVLIFTEFSRARKLAATINRSQSPNTFDSIIAVSPSFRRVVSEARLYAQNDSTILLLGESGTGKDVMAQAIHNASARRTGPFVPVNCGAMQKELVAAELFGYEAGAFTGARRGGSVGKFEYANGGTLFLDEIGEMPLDVQPILLRALESHTITKLGGKTPIPVNVRIIAATNRDLYSAVAAGTFRGDLLYRLDIFSLRLPPLRERKEDISALIESMTMHMNVKYGKAVTGLSPEALERMTQYDWPGNIRELRNYMERCVVLADSSQIQVDMLPNKLRSLSPAADAPREAAFSTLPKPAGAGVPDHCRQAELRRLLEQYHWNITRVSQALGVTRATVYRRMKHYGIQP